MTIDIVEFDSGDFGRWNDLVERAPSTSPFHRTEALTLQAGHSKDTLHPLVGLNGQEPVGLFPLFERNKGPLTAVFSPPPPLWIHRLGPAMMDMAGFKQRTRDRLRQEFIDGCFEWLAEHCDPDYVRLQTEDAFRDLRPFKWNGADVTPEFTYIVDLDRTEDDLLGAFSSDARRNLRKPGGEYTITEGGVEDAERIVEQVRERFADQRRSFALPTSFVADLYRQLPDGVVRPYVLHHQGEFVSGILTFETDDRIHRWQGGVKTDVDLPANDLLDWHVMTDAMGRGIEQYDLVGAGERRINRYKAKFNPGLRTFYTVEDGSTLARALVALYERFG